MYLKKIDVFISYGMNKYADYFIKKFIRRFVYNSLTILLCKIIVSASSMCMIFSSDICLIGSIENFD